jgi:hypothetical protein
MGLDKPQQIEKTLLKDQWDIVQLPDPFIPRLDNRGGGITMVLERQPNEYFDTKIEY